MRKGKKKTIILLLNRVYKQISSNLLGISIPYFFSLVFFKLITNIEVRKVAFRNKIHFIPFPLKKKRKIFLILKWIKQYLLVNSNKISLDKKLYNELFLLVFNDNASSIFKFKLDNEKKAFQYKSKAHFRWY